MKSSHARRRVPAVSAVAVLTGILTSTGAGRAAAQTLLQEVVITAERRETLLRHTPVSVGVVDRADIEAKGVSQLNDLVGLVAGVSVPNGFSNMPQAVGIRGVGVSQPAMIQAVGIYVDDVPLLRGYATALWDLPDIERFEVLRGPQSTLYGQSSTAGAVKVISADPTTQKAAWVSAGVGNLGARELRGFATGALDDTRNTSGSLALSVRRNDGFAYNAVRGEGINQLDALQFRAKLKWSTGPGFNAVLAVDGLRDRSDTNTLNYPLNHPAAAPRVSYTAVDAGAFERRASGLMLRIEARLGDAVKLRAITGYRTYLDDPTVVDWGGLEVQRYGLSQRVKQRALSQEVQLLGRHDALQWTAGAIVVGDRFDFERFVTAYPLAAPAPAYTEARTEQKTTDVGFYAQGRLALAADLALTGGLRAYRTRQTGENAFWRTDAERNRTQQVYLAPDLVTSASGVLPRIGVDMTWNARAMSYASLAKGAKFGGFNRAAESLTSARVAARPEKVTTLEIGSKGRTADGALSMSVAVFRNDYREYLASVQGATIGGVLVTDSVLLNAGKARTYGIDLELAARMAPLTDASLSLELLRSKFLDFMNPTGATATNYAGNELPNAPRLSLGATLNHAFYLQDGGRVKLSGWVQHIRAGYGDIANSERLRVPSQTYLNLSASYEPAQHWTFSLRVRNLADKTYVLNRVSIPPLGVDAAYYNAPRTVMATARYEFQ